MSNHRQTKGNARRRSFIDNMAYSLSQMIYGKEIRINRALNQGELEEYLQAALDELLEMEQRRMAQEADLAAVKRASAIPGVPSLKVEESSFYKDQMHLQAEVLTGLWRLRGRLVKPGSNEPLEETKRAYRHFETAWDALVNAGFRVEDYTKQPFRTGLNVDVLAYEEAPGLSSEIILETVKPGVFFNDTLIQRGEVIVGTPEAK
jgi:hypothetical protein